MVLPHLGPSPGREVLIPAFFNLSRIFPGLPDGGRSRFVGDSYLFRKTQGNWSPTNPGWFKPST
jgi:hypothetical protein